MILSLVTEVCVNKQIGLEACKTLKFLPRTYNPSGFTTFHSASLLALLHGMEAVSVELLYSV